MKLDLSWSQSIEHSIAPVYGSRYFAVSMDIEKIENTFPEELPPIKYRY